MNVPVLWATAAAFGYETPIWGTYKQWHERGCQVRKGEKAAMVVFWKSISVTHQGDDGEIENDDRLIARGYFVFNAAQVDGFDPSKVSRSEQSVEDLDETQRIEAAERFFAASHADVRHGGNRAFYTPAGDFIQMPKFEQFRNAPAYSACLPTSTRIGLVQRLGSIGNSALGSAMRLTRSRELVAELGAAFICAGLGIEN